MIQRLADTFGLAVDLGQHTRPWAPRAGWWVRPPSADYRCPCGHVASASGDAVPAFVATTQANHQAACPLQPTPKET